MCSKGWTVRHKNRCGTILLTAILMSSCSLLVLSFFDEAAYAERIFFNFRDNFNNGKISAKFTIATQPGISVIEQQGVLRIQGSSTTPLSIGQAMISIPLTATAQRPAITSADIRLGDIDQDTFGTARIALVQDPDNFLVFGMLEPYGVYYQQKQGAGTLTQTILGIPRDTEFHNYRIEYDGSSAKLFFDNVQAATVDIELDGFQVWLQAHTHFLEPGAVLGEFDRFKVKAPLAYS